MARAVVRYAKTSDELEIAYQVLGDGPLDVVIVPGMVSSLDRNADYPSCQATGQGGGDYSTPRAGSHPFIWEMSD